MKKKLQSLPCKVFKMSVPKASSQTSAKIIRFAFSHASSPDSKLLRTIAIRINSTGLKRLSKNKSIQFFNQYSTSSASSQNNVQPSPRTLSIRQFSTTSLQKSDTSPTLLSTDEYHKLSDTYIDSLVSKLEAMQEEREDIDVEYSVCDPLHVNQTSKPPRFRPCINK